MKESCDLTVCLIISNNVSTVRDYVWTRNGTTVTTNAANHRLVLSYTTRKFTDLDVTQLQADDNTVHLYFYCSHYFISIVALNVTGKYLCVC